MCNRILGEESRLFILPYHPRIQLSIMNQQNFFILFLFVILQLIKIMLKIFYTKAYHLVLVFRSLSPTLRPVLLYSVLPYYLS